MVGEHYQSSPSVRWVLPESPSLFLHVISIISSVHWDKCYSSSSPTMLSTIFRSFMCVSLFTPSMFPCQLQRSLSSANLPIPFLWNLHIFNVDVVHETHLRVHNIVDERSRCQVSRQLWAPESSTPLSSSKSQTTWGWCSLVCAIQKSGSHMFRPTCWERGANFVFLNSFSIKYGVNVKYI